MGLLDSLTQDLSATVDKIGSMYSDSMTKAPSVPQVSGLLQSQGTQRPTNLGVDAIEAASGALDAGDAGAEIKNESSTAGKIIDAAKYGAGLLGSAGAEALIPGIGPVIGLMTIGNHFAVPINPRGMLSN